MANKNTYKANKFRSDFTTADIEGDAADPTIQLDENYDTALAQMNKVVSQITQELDKINSAMKKLNGHVKSGKEVQNATKTVMTKLDKIKTNLTNTLNNFTNIINSAEKEEWKRFMKWYKEQQAKDAGGDDTNIG